MTVDEPPTGEPALARLFAMAFRQVIDVLHERLREEGWDDVRPAHGFVLLAARGSSTTVTEVAALTGTTKQAASKLVDSMVVAGYLARGTSDDDGRRRPIVVTELGDELLDAVERIYRDIEADWASVIGPRGVDRLRRDLVRVLTAAHDGELPPVRPTW